MNLSLKDVDLDLIERTAEKRGMPAFQLLRAIADIVETTPKAADRPIPPDVRAVVAASTPPKALGRVSHHERYRRICDFDCVAAAWFVRGLPLGQKATAFDIVHAVWGTVPEGRGLRRQLTGLVAKIDGLAPVITRQAGHGPCARRETAWGPSNLFERVPLLTAPQRPNHDRC
jgi:hypothetical protein